MNTDRAQALYYDSAATLRLVDTQLDDLGDGEPARMPDAEPMAAPRALQATITLADLPRLLERANGEINGLLTRLRESRGALQATAVDKLTHTQRKLREVTNATELAATDIMDACDRATTRLDALDALDGDAEHDRAAAAALRLELRDELFTMMSALQFQDLTTQMLSHATAVLTEVEERLQEVASLFEGAMQTDQPHAAGAERPARPTNLAYDPNASVENAERRQAVADSVFAPGVGGVAAA
jgi:hypothetical protein